MFIGIDEFLRARRRLLTAAAAVLLALALFATHGALTSAHHGGDHADHGERTIVTVCLAIVETGTAVVALAAAALLLRRSRARVWPPTPIALATASPRATGPPTPPSPDRLQVFLR